MDIPNPSAFLEEPKQEAAEAPKQLPPTTVISIDVEDSSGRRYQGKFVYSVPTLRHMVAIARIKAGYLPGGSPMDAAGAAIVEMLSYLEVTIGKENRPDWFTNSLDLYDMTPVSELYKEALDYERKFHRGSANAGSSGASAGAGSDRTDQSAVVEDVEPTPQRRETLFSHG